MTPTDRHMFRGLAMFALVIGIPLVALCVMLARLPKCPPGSVEVKAGVCVAAECLREPAK